MKSLKKLWNEKKIALKEGKMEHACSLNIQIIKRIKEEKK